jgi:hypothetical protein
MVVQSPREAYVLVQQMRSSTLPCLSPLTTGRVNSKRPLRLVPLFPISYILEVEPHGLVYLNGLRSIKCKIMVPLDRRL